MFNTNDLFSTQDEWHVYTSIVYSFCSCKTVWITKLSLHQFKNKTTYSREQSFWEASLFLQVTIKKKRERNDNAAKFLLQTLIPHNNK